MLFSLMMVYKLLNMQEIRFKCLYVIGIVHLVGINLLAPELFFLILAHSVYKMWIIQEPNKL